MTGPLLVAAAGPPLLLYVVSEFSKVMVYIVEFISTVASSTTSFPRRTKISQVLTIIARWIPGNTRSPVVPR